ncbi:hypothetical protein Scep_010903 [Stephania cephalantha]|uniref:Uncharacterized protein n=1 Tax=Stephania cephalantha TaxID=152367 RepID=A0AAP0JW31_9MAGN
MATRPSCSSGDSRSSSPIPLIGLYIAGATAVCFLLMLCDIISSFRHKTRYIPCKWFALNSATLTLLAIASKLPVDLTTYMPSAGDQLSKLTGTTMVCISICFLVPSLGINGETESITNMIALSLFVVTIAVNICIQIYTGVIFSFIVEHMMILCCMLTMLTVMWVFNFFISNKKTALVETIRNIFIDIKATSLLHQVKLWYLSSCISNPQYVLRGGDYSLSLVMICFVCLAVVSQAALRSLFHKLEICEGVSDYGWSIPTIIVIQIITIVVGSLATAFRWITIASDPALNLKNESDFDLQMYLDIERFSFQYLTKKRKVRMVTIIFVFYFLLKMAIVLTAAVTFCVLGAPVYVIRMIFRYCCSSFTRAVNISEKWKTELRGVFPSSEMFPEWIMRIRVEDMDKWIDLSDKSPPNHLVQLLSKPPSHPPQTLLNKLQQVDAAKGYYRLSCLSLVILVKIVALAIPLALAEPILQALDEVFELIYYIDKKINVGNFEDQRKRQFAKVLLKYKNTHLSKKDSATSHRSIRKQYHLLRMNTKHSPLDLQTEK